MSRREAERRARIEFGGFEVAREECRDVDSWRHIDALARSVKYALRSLAKSPGFALISRSILAVAVASNLAVFSLLDSLLLRPLPVDRPGELVRISSIDKDGQLGELPSSMIDSLGKSSAFQGVCGFDTSIRRRRSTEVFVLRECSG